MFLFWVFCREVRSESNSTNSTATTTTANTTAECEKGFVNKNGQCVSEKALKALILLYGTQVKQ
ncbi:MAG: hypothetical protein N4A38_01225 [Candidatus Gracilibacteria bacterium]|nr:hypothetical protein [Candidatus Gracilibacteria bacterium]